MEGEFAQLIHAAIDQKYGEWSLGDVKSIVAKSLNEFVRAQSEQALIRQRMVTTDFVSDVVNQARCLFCIETYWRHQIPVRGFMRKVHAVSCGMRTRDVCWRIAGYVPDYGGEVTWPVDGIKRGVRTIASELARLGELQNASAVEKGEFLASIFAWIIRVHPFRDGNGRTSRMLVEFCLRFWSDDYILVPKVRNSVQWRIGVEEAVSGRLGQLSSYFARRIHPRQS